MSKHRNDTYGDVSRDRELAENQSPAIPAATVLLLREHTGEPEVLMLHKNSKIAFGGMWVFPGGKIDDADFGGTDDPHQAARNAAVRETVEEAGIEIPGEEFIFFSHWTPPPSTPKRFATWFFVTRTDDDHEISIDGGEIMNHQWISPGKALDQHAAGKIDLAPPTWVSLYQLTRFNTVEETITHLSGMEPRYYETHVARDEDGTRVAMWHGDAGYDEWDAGRPGATHRLVMHTDGFAFHHSAAEY